MYCLWEWNWLLLHINHINIHKWEVSPSICSLMPCLIPIVAMLLQCWPMWLGLTRSIRATTYTTPDALNTVDKGPTGGIISPKRNSCTGMPLELTLSGGTIIANYTPDLENDIVRHTMTVEEIFDWCLTKTSEVNQSLILSVWHIQDNIMNMLAPTGIGEATIRIPWVDVASQPPGQDRQGGKMNQPLLLLPHSLFLVSTWCMMLLGSKTAHDPSFLSFSQI